MPIKHLRESRAREAYQNFQRADSSTGLIEILLALFFGPALRLAADIGVDEKEAVADRPAVDEEGVEGTFVTDICFGAMGVLRGESVMFAPDTART